MDDGLSLAERVRVVVRVRPHNEREGQDDLASSSSSNILKVDDAAAQVYVCKKKKRKAKDGGGESAELERELRCSYDRVFGPTTSQQSVFEYLQDSVQQVAQGFNCTIFAYGQTGTGKTHTMLGKDIERHIESLSTGSASASTTSSSSSAAAPPPVARESWGVIPRAVESLFEELRAISRHGAAAIVHCSYMQIYNNDVFDLLQENRQRMKEPLAVREMIKGNSKHVYVSGLSEFRVASLDETLKLLKTGNRNRTIRATEYNEKSSRSHALLQISAEVESRGVEGATTIIRRAKLNLVDLAGSEKWDTDVAMGSDRCKELTAINQSLSALGNVISALANPKRTHIPYRDSKLTRLLQDSLGGNTRTVVIATISPSESALDETISTLQFADRAKSIVVRVKVNEMVDDAILLARAQREIAHLKVLLKQSGSQQQVVELEEQVAKLKKENAALLAENKRLRRRAGDLNSTPCGRIAKSAVSAEDATVSGGARDSRSALTSFHDAVSSPPLNGVRERALVQSEASEPLRLTVPPAQPAPPLNQLRLDLLGAATPFDAAAQKPKAFSAFLDADDGGASSELREQLSEAEREHERILRGIQTERRELEHQLEQLSLSPSPAQGGRAKVLDGKQGNNSDTQDDDDELCPMCGRSIDEHSDEALDVCIEKEELEMKARQEFALKPSTPSTQSKSKPFAKRRSLREGGGATNNAAGPARSAGSNPASIVSASSQDEPDEPTTTSFLAESNQLEPQGALPGDVPILRHSHKSVKALKKLHALSPYNLRLLKRASGAAGDKKAGAADPKAKSDANASSSSSANPPDANLVAITNSVRDIGLKLSVYKFRYDCWYPCAVVGFDGKRKLHCCQFEFGDKQWTDLKERKIRVVGRVGLDDDDDDGA